MVMLACKQPKLRQHAAESLLTTLVMVSCRSKQPEQVGVWAKTSAWSAQERLLAICWDSSDLHSIKAARSKIIAALDLEAPVPRVKHGSAPRSGKVQDTTTSYQDLLDNANRRA
jgi:hypothetical protein